jgi:hypothetical protein
MICDKIEEPEPDHYYLALNYEKEMQDNMVFDPYHKNGRFQMIMRTKWLLEYIAEKAMQKQRLAPELRHVLDTDTPVTESEFHRNCSTPKLYRFENAINREINAKKTVSP